MNAIPISISIEEFKPRDEKAFARDAETFAEGQSVWTAIINVAQIIGCGAALFAALYVICVAWLAF